LARDDRDVTLASLRGGAGIEPGVFLVTDSSGASAGVNLAGAATIGDVIDRINAASVSVTAAVNESGTGIELTDTAGGVEKLKVADLGSGVAASQLRLAGESTSTGSATKTINGSGLFAADAIEKGALNGVVARLNELKGGFRASLVFDGVGYRVALTAERTGAANELLVDGRSAGLTFSDSTRPADAAAVFGPKGSGGFAITSSTNSFSSVLDGVDLTVVVGSGEAVTVEVTSDDKPLVNAVKSFVESYNSVRTSLDEYTEFDAEGLTTGVLFGRNEVTRVDSELARLMSGRFQIGSQSRSLGSIGLSLDDDGKLVLDESRLKEAFEDDPTELQEFFTRTSGGVVDQVQRVVDGLAGKTNSLLSSRSDTLQRLVVSNNEQLKRWDGRLERQRAALEAQFFTLEQTVALLQTNLETLNQFQPVQPLASSRN
jgi:flagellar hook-associated protein 2